MHAVCHHAVGPKLNADKCKIQCSLGGKPDACSKAGSSEFYHQAKVLVYWVLFFTLSGGTTREIHNRINVAWGKFHQMWPLLKHRDASLRQRLRLFNAVVVRSLLWGSESWMLTVREKHASGPYKGTC